MSEIYVAHDAASYVEMLQGKPLSSLPILKNRMPSLDDIVGYKVVVTGDRYSSFVQRRGATIWEAWDLNKPLDRARLDRHVAEGHLQRDPR